MKLTPVSEVVGAACDATNMLYQDRTNTHKRIMEVIEGRKQYAETTPQVFASDNIKNALLRGRVESRNQTLTDLKQEIDNLFSA